MPRNLRCVLPGVAYHVTQRGVNRGDVFFSHADRQVYLQLVKEQLTDAGVRVLAWCLMTNHVHWIVVPAREDSLAVLFRRVHGRYAQYLNARRGRMGHLWQNRYFACAVDARKESTVLRYVEWNPVRAALVEEPIDYRWSSASAHLKGPDAEEFPILDWNYWRERGGAKAWATLIGTLDDPREIQSLKRCTYAGAPLGSVEFVTEMEQIFGRKWQKQGRPRKGVVKQGKGTEASGTFMAAG
ncbi:MAG: transposase [Acidobacteriota bacterium]